jgi:elongation factor Ts
MVLLSCETDFVAKNPEFMNLARDLAMQVAATNPTYLTSEEISAEAKQAATAVFEKEVADKPKEMQAKIIEGKLASYFRDQVLLEQSFIKDDSKTVRVLLNEATQKFGERAEVTKFARLSAR